MHVLRQIRAELPREETNGAKDNGRRWWTILELFCSFRIRSKSTLWGRGGEDLAVYGKVTNGMVRRLNLSGGIRVEQEASPWRSGLLASI